MIRADVNMTGAIKRSATTRTDKNENPYLSFVVKVNLPDAKGKGRDLEVLVTYKGGRKVTFPSLRRARESRCREHLTLERKGKTCPSILPQARFQPKMCQTMTE